MMIRVSNHLVSIVLRFQYPFSEGDWIPIDIFPFGKVWIFQPCLTDLRSRAVLAERFSSPVLPRFLGEAIRSTVENCVENLN